VEFSENRSERPEATAISLQVRGQEAHEYKCNTGKGQIEIGKSESSDAR
jgi:hypothetical protein